MPSDKHNSKTAGARDLISSLINIASARDVPFHQPKQLKCLHHGVTFYPFDLPVLIITPKPVLYLLSDTLGVLVRHSQAQKCLQINPKPFH